MTCKSWDTFSSLACSVSKLARAANAHCKIRCKVVGLECSLFLNTDRGDSAVSGAVVVVELSKDLLYVFNKEDIASITPEARTCTRV